MGIQTCKELDLRGRNEGRDLNKAKGGRISGAEVLKLAYKERHCREGAGKELDD